MNLFLYFNYVNLSFPKPVVEINDTVSVGSISDLKCYPITKMAKKVARQDTDRHLLGTKAQMVVKIK